MIILSRVRRMWEKNAPEVAAVVRGRMPRFVLAPLCRKSPPYVPVFCYHRVWAPTFDADLRFLCRNGYHTLTADELCDHLDGAAPAPPRSVVLTIDDGAASLYDVALPLLRNHNLRAVAFVSPLFHLPREEMARHQPTPGLCTYEQIIELQLSGHVDVQSHTMSHRYLPRYPRPMPLTDADPAWQQRCRGPALTIEEELAASKSTLESWLDKPVRHLAWPAYRGTPAALALAQRLGYRGFFCGCNARSNSHPTTRIQRISGEFVRRMPGHGRVSLPTVMRRRFGG